MSNRATVVSRHYLLIKVTYVMQLTTLGKRLMAGHLRAWRRSHA